MARKINNNLLEKLTSGNLQPLLDYIKSDKELRLEIRLNGEAFIYYKKGKVLEIRSLKVDKKYGNLPDTQLAISNPKEYFSQIKQVVDIWVNSKKDRREFETQQNIAQSNQEIEDKYIILDMEYNFSQAKIPHNEQLKRAGFDLLGLERTTGKVVFFEVKKGLTALEDKAGIKNHIEDFENYLFCSKNNEIYRKRLKQDIENIVSDKKNLGVLDYSLPENFSMKDVEFAFIFEPNGRNNNDEIVKYEEIYKSEHKESKGSHKQYKTFFISPNNRKLDNYKIL